VAFLLQTSTEAHEIFDDAVVNHGDPVRAVLVRMGVLVGRLPVGGPPRVTDAQRRRRGGSVTLFLESSLQPGQFSGRFRNAQIAVHQRDTRGVVAAVFQPV
jgi:hypothetical protein